MTIRLKQRKFYDEYLYKLLFIVLGILFWVYGMMHYVDIILSALVVITLIPMVIILIRCKMADFKRITAILILLFGCATLLFCKYKRPTLVMLLYTEIKLLVLGYCAEEKSAQDLKSELEMIFKTVAIIGTIILIISLATYLSGISVAYVFNESEEATTLYLGRDPTRNALCGIFANSNMISNLCIIYLGSILYLFEQSKYKLFAIFLIALDCIVQFYTASRGGLVGILVVLGIYTWFKYKSVMSKNQFSQSIRWFTIIAATIIIIIMMCVMEKHINVFGILNRTEESFAHNNQIRIYLWRAAFKASTNNIITIVFGIGHRISETMEIYAEVALPKRLYTNVHNAYLQEALEYGFPAAITMIAYFYTVLRMSWIHMKKRTKNDNMPVLFGIVLALLIVNLVETDLLGREIQGSFVWIIVGYIYALSMANEKSIGPNIDL